MQSTVCRVKHMQRYTAKAEKDIALAQLAHKQHYLYGTLSHCF